MSAERERLIELEEKLRGTIPYPIWSGNTLMFYKMLDLDLRNPPFKVHSGIRQLFFNQKSKKIVGIEYKLCLSTLSLFLQIMEFLKSKKITPTYKMISRKENGKVPNTLQLNLGEHGRIYVRPEVRAISLYVDNDSEKVKIVDEMRDYLKSSLKT